MLHGIRKAKKTSVCCNVLLFHRYKDGKPISAEEFEKFKIILESEDREIEDGLKECTFSLTIPRCTLPHICS